MIIKNMMTKNPITIDPETSIHDAKKIMDNNKVRRLPVIKHNRLVGLVTERMLLEAAPSQASTLSIHEIHYLLAKMKVEDIMVKDPITITSDMPAEEALKLGQEKGFGGFPVVDNGKLVGITTETDIIRLITLVLGVREKGVRIDIELNNEFGNLKKIMSIIDDMKAPLLSLMAFSRPEDKKNKCHIFMRVKSENGKAIADKLTEEGFKVLGTG